MSRIGAAIALISLLACLFYGVLYVVNSLHSIDSPNTDYNTIYSKKHSEKMFDEIKIGTTAEELAKIIGQPFRNDSIEFRDVFLYTNSPNDVLFIPGKTSGLRFRGGNDSLNYACFSFDKEGNVRSVFSDFQLGGMSNAELKKLNKEKLIKTFGKPQKQMICNRKCEVLSYSGLKDGRYTGKVPEIRIRKVLIRDGIVIDRIKTTGNPYNPYCGTCKIINN